MAGRRFARAGGLQCASALFAQAGAWHVHWQSFLPWLAGGVFLGVVFLQLDYTQEDFREWVSTTALMINFAVLLINVTTSIPFYIEKERLEQDLHNGFAQTPVPSSAEVGDGGGHRGAPTDRGGGNTAIQNAGATPGGTGASAADKEEGGSAAGGATRTAGTGNQNAGDGRACAWRAATTKGMAWPASPVATGCQSNPCSTGIRWGVPPAAQMDCLRNRRGCPPGADQP